VSSRPSLSSIDRWMVLWIRHGNKEDIVAVFDIGICLIARSDGTSLPKRSVD